MCSVPFFKYIVIITQNSFYYFAYFLELSHLSLSVSWTISRECQHCRDKCMVIAVASGMVTGLVAAGKAVDH